MSFRMFVILLVVGLVFINGEGFLSKLIGVFLLVIAFNPLSISMTGHDIPTNFKKMWNTGEKAYTATNKGLKKVGDTVSSAIDTVKDKTGK